MLTGDMYLKRNQMSSRVDCKDAMIKDSAHMEYWFVAMGRSPLGSGYAFSASGFLFYPDDTPPQVVKLTTTSTDKLSSDPAVAGGMKYSGTVMVTFSNDLYFKKDNNTYLQVVDKSVADLIGPGNDEKYISSDLVIVGENISIKHQATESGYPKCMALLIRYRNVVPNHQIAFKSNLADSHGNTGSVALTLTMKLVKNELGLWEPKYEVTSPGWENP